MPVSRPRLAGNSRLKADSFPICTKPECEQYFPQATLSTVHLSEPTTGGINEHGNGRCGI